MSHEGTLAGRLREAGYAVQRTEQVAGGAIAAAGLVTLRDGAQVFAKTLDGPETDVFAVEAEGLTALRELGGANTPDVLHASTRLLVLAKMLPRRDDERFWERLAHMVAALHASTVGDRFGWHRDGWLGRLRQDNAWERDGHVFFAERRLLRWLSEPPVEAAFDRRERRALERLCAALPELVPAQPPCLIHGDLWRDNLLATAEGEPVLVDPAVSYGWAEADLSMLWCAPRPPASERFFAVYREVAGLQDGWERRMPLLHLREHLSAIAHEDDAWDPAKAVREAVAPFMRRD